MICPHCKQPLTESEIIALSASTLGKIKTKKKAKSSAKNGKLGGRPLGSKNKPKEKK